MSQEHTRAERAVCALLTAVAALCGIPSLQTKEWEQKYDNDTFRFVYVGIGGPTEDEEYFSNPILHKNMPRGYIEIYHNGKLVRIIHGCNKFFGEEDETTQGIDAKSKIPKVCVGDFTVGNIMNPKTMVDITAKANGKFMTFTFFRLAGKKWVVLSSKTTCVVFRLGGNAPSFSKNGSEENLILKGMYETFNGFWNKLTERTRYKLLQKSIAKNFTFLCEYEDGAHMVPLEPGSTSKLVITMAIRCDQTGNPSKSEMLHLINGYHFTTWLAKIGVRPVSIIQHLLVSIQEWDDKYSKEYSNTNFFKASKIIEGYVVRFVSANGKIMGLMKSKTWEYIIKRSIREILRGLIRSSKKNGKPISPADAGIRIRKKITGPKAYPQGLNKPAIDKICHLASDFVQFCLDTHASKGVSLSCFVNFGGVSGADEVGSPNGMAETWEMFLQHNGGHGLPECFASEPESEVQAEPSLAAVDPKQFVPEMGVIGAIAAFIQACSSGSSKYRLGDVGITATCYGRQSASNIAPVVIFQAISGTGKSTLCAHLAAMLPGSVIACADDFFKVKFGGKFIPKFLGQAHAACRETAFSAAKNVVVFICNTNCNLRDSFEYVLHAIKSERPIIFLEMIPGGTFVEFSPKLAARGEHVFDTDILEKQWNTMTNPANRIPPSYGELLKRLGISNASGDAKSSAVSKPHPGHTRQGSTPYTAMVVEMQPCFSERFPHNRKLHITLKFGQHSECLLSDPKLKDLKVKVLEVREFIDPANPANFIVCGIVSSPVLNELQVQGLVQDHLHITLRFSGCFKPVDSRKLLDGTICPTSITKVPEEMCTVVASVAAM